MSKTAALMSSKLPLEPQRLANAGSESLPAVVPFPHWQRARDRACAAILAGETRLLITGPAGTGKTVLVHEIARILRYAGWHSTVRNAGMKLGGRGRPL